MALRLLPREEIFFDLFNQMAQIILQGARMLKELLDDYRHVEQRAAALKAVEEKGDDITHQIIDRLNRTFVTPLDREDILELAKKLDRIDGVVQEINRLENLADHVQRDAIAKLFTQNGNPIEVIKWKEVYETLEEATDQAEDVANVLNTIRSKKM